jgi:uncharacterized protein (TIGR02145 family)
MKHLFTLFLSITIFINLQANTPARFNYQAVLRDPSGQIISSQQVDVTIKILKSSAQGEEIFSEAHQVTSNEFGLINLQIGSQNSLESINWSDNSFFIQVAVDGELMGTSQLLSVPFALHSSTSADAFSGNYLDLFNVPSLENFIQVENPQDGDLAIFTGSQWHRLPIGQPGQVLMVIDGTLQWTDLPDSGGENGDENTVTDIEGNVYRTVIIGNQLWMAENLRATKYANGDDIPTGLTNNEWSDPVSGAYAVYPHENAEGINSQQQMLKAYGALYNWHAVNDARGLCPAGWHVPSDAEWTELTSYISSQNPVNIGNQLKSCLQQQSPLGGDCAADIHPRWNSNSNHHGTDLYEFSGLPAGYRGNFGSYSSLGIYGRWWTSSQLNATHAWYRYVFNSGGDVLRYDYGKRTGFSIRCIKTQ